MFDWIQHHYVFTLLLLIYLAGVMVFVLDALLARYIPSYPSWGDVGVPNELWWAVVLWPLVLAYAVALKLNPKLRKPDGKAHNGD